MRHHGESAPKTFIPNFDFWLLFSSFLADEAPQMALELLFSHTRDDLERLSDRRSEKQVLIRINVIDLFFNFFIIVIVDFSDWQSWKQKLKRWHANVLVMNNVKNEVNIIIFSLHIYSRKKK